jgi:hypothetical protein
MAHCNLLTRLLLLLLLLVVIIYVAALVLALTAVSARIEIGGCCCCPRHCNISWGWCLHWLLRLSCDICGLSDGSHWLMRRSGVHHLTLLLLLLLRLLLLVFLQAGQLSPDLHCQPQTLQQHGSTSCLPCSGVGGYLCGRLQGCPHSQLLLETCNDAP